MKKLLSVILIMSLIVPFCVPNFSYAEENADKLIAKESEWEYVVYEKTGDSLVPAPEGWLDGKDSETWETAQAPFAAHSWPSPLAHTVLPYTYYSLYCRRTFTVADLSALKGLTMEIIYDEDPIVYINGTQVWSAAGYKDSVYTAVDFEFFADILKEGTNTVCVEIKNVNGGGIMDLALTGDTRPRLIEKETAWKYLFSDDSSAAGPENWTTCDAADWEEGLSPFAGSAWPNFRANTRFSAGSFAAWLRKDFEVTNAAAITSLTMGIIYDEDPTVYLNGTLVWSATGYKDAGYTKVDLTDYIGLLRNGTNKLAVSFKNAPTGGGSVLGLELYADAVTVDPIKEDGTVAMRSVFSFGADGTEKHNPWGALGCEDNMFDGKADTVWGWNFEKGMGVELRFYDTVSLDSLFLQAKNEGKLTNDTGAHGRYIVAVRNESTGAFETVGTVDALIEGTTLKLNGVKTSAVRITVDEWYNNNWGNIAEAKLFGKVLTDRYDLNGDGSVNIADVTVLLNYLAGNTSAVKGNPDINGDGTVDISDVTALLDFLAK